MSMVERKNTEKSRSLSDSQASMLSVAEGESVIVVMDPDTGKSMKLTDDQKALLATLEDEVKEPDER